jgi:tetratricopeptide (TPR) repeat protein
LKRVLSVALAVSILSGYACPASIAAEVQDTGKAAVNFEKRESLGYVVRFDKGPLPFGGFLCGLVSVDNKDLSKFTESQVKDLLYGPVGSTLEVEFMSPDGKTKTETLRREPVINKPLVERNGLLYLNYDNRNGQNVNSSFVADSLDIEGRATQNLLIQALKEWPEGARADNLSPAMFSTAIINYEAGDIADGDKYLDLSEKEYVTAQRWFPFQNRQLGKALKVLISVGRMDDAQKVVDMVVDGGTLQIFTADDLFKTLAEAQLKDDKKAAVATVEKFLRVIKTNPGVAAYGRTWVADVFEQAGEYKRAEEIYSEFVRTFQASDKRWENLERLASYVFKRSSLQNRLGDKTGAIAGLQDIIEKIKANLPATQLGTIEKMPGVFPVKRRGCTPDIWHVLDKMYCQKEKA